MIKKWSNLIGKYFKAFVYLFHKVHNLFVYVLSRAFRRLNYISLWRSREECCFSFRLHFQAHTLCYYFHSRYIYYLFYTLKKLIMVLFHSCFIFLWSQVNFKRRSSSSTITLLSFHNSYNWLAVVCFQFVKYSNRFYSGPKDHKRAISRIGTFIEYKNNFWRILFNKQKSRTASAAVW